MLEEHTPLMACLDLGTSKVTIMVAEVSKSGSINVIGTGQQACHGIKGGMIVDIDATVEAIKCAKENAELMARCDITSVVVGLGGHDIQCQKSSGMSPIADKEVTQLDMQKVSDTAKAVNIPTQHTMVHALAQEYGIDGQWGVLNPLGMSGRRLEVSTHIITGPKNTTNNIEKCLQRCNLELDGWTVNQLASSEAVLNLDEKKLGVCLIDMGAGCLDIAVYGNNVIQFNAVIEGGGDQVTETIAKALSTPISAAEDIKVSSGCAKENMSDHSEVIRVPSIGDRPASEISRKSLAEVIEPCYVNFFEQVKSSIENTVVADDLVGGIVLTGGAATMHGVVELAQDVFQLSVRLQQPSLNNNEESWSGDPRLSTSQGLLIYSHANKLYGHASEANEPAPKLTNSAGKLLKKSLESIKNMWSTTKNNF